MLYMCYKWYEADDNNSTVDAYISMLYDIIQNVMAWFRVHFNGQSGREIMGLKFLTP